jgi:single-stranded-DNA-specific exonuclease
MQRLYESNRRMLDDEKYLDLVALSTVCDMAPLRAENRWLVREGLRALAKAERPGLRALFEAAGCDPAHVTADTIGYVLGPRLNAAGRLAHARHSLDLLLERDELKARALALQLCDLNSQRQKATHDAMELAKGLVAELPPGQPLIFIGHESIPSGIVGLVAGRLMEEHHRPAVVYERGDETSRASCRSIPEFDITGALRNVAPLMVRFGGHRAAAGFTVENGNLEALRESLVSQAGEVLAGVDLAPVIDIDAAIPLGRVNGELVRSLTALSPFGVGNDEPVFLSRDLEVRDVRVMGEDGKHLRLQLRDGRVTWPAVAFGFGQSELETGHRLDVVYTFSADRGGDGAMELRLIDFVQTDA